MAKYKFKGFTISCCGYHQPDHCVWWEAVDDSGCAFFHGTTLREVEFMILDSEWEDKLKAKDREIAELRDKLKVAEEFATEMKQSTNSLVRSCGHQMILRLQGEGANNEGK